MIIDNKEMRGEAVEFNHGKSRVFRTINEPATINLLAWQAVAEAIEQGDSVVLVEGEEDSLTLVAILVAPRWVHRRVRTTRNRDSSGANFCQKRRMKFKH